MSSKLLRALNARALNAEALAALTLARVRSSVPALVSTGSSRAVVATDGEVDDVVEETVLCLGDENRLVVSRSVDAAETVDTSRETGCDLDVEVALRVRRGVDTLEECELGVVEGSSLRHALELLNNEVGMANDVVLRVQLLRRRVVVRLSVDKVAVSGVSDKLSRTKDYYLPSLEVLDGHCDGEGRVRGNVAHVGRVDELGRRLQSRLVLQNLRGFHIALTMFDTGAIMPIGAGLQEPVLICCPFVMGSSG